MKRLIGKKIRIIEMKGEPQYTGKEGIVISIDDAMQLHGTWGGCAIIPTIDIYEVFPDNEENNYLYMVEFDWSVENGCDIETELFSTYEKALNHYDEIIANEKTDGMSWVADAINPDGTILKGYTFEEFGDRTKKEDLSWHFTMDNYYCFHSIISLKKLQIK